MKNLFGIILFALVINVSYAQIMYNYPYQMECSYFPSYSQDSVTNVFSNNGSWFGLGLPSVEETNRFGKFAGPYSFYNDKWIGRSLIKFNFGIDGIGKIQYEFANDFEIVQYPGLLYQKFVFDDFFIEIKAAFVSGRTCLFEAKAINTSDKILPMSWMINGDAYEEMGETDRFTDVWMYKIDGKDDIFWLLRYKLDDEINLVFQEDAYEISYKKPQWIEPNDTLSIVTTLSQYFKGDDKSEVEMVTEALNNPKRFFDNNEKMWTFLISNVVAQNEMHKKISVKALQTLLMNLRSLIPDFKSYFFVERNGLNNEYINVDENWFYASSMIRYDISLATHALVSAMSNLNQDNSLNTIVPVLNHVDNIPIISEKPMAAWTAWNIVSIKSDTNIMKVIYPLIKANHEFWYSHRDDNNNFWCEDNLGVERVDVNAMLFSEKYCLKKIAERLGYLDDVKMYKEQMDSIKLAFNHYFFDIQQSEYVNINIKSGQKIAADDVIGYALWAGLASLDIADFYSQKLNMVVNNGAYKSKFESGDFDIEYYYFLISGLNLYKYETVADNLLNILLETVLDDSKNKPLPSYGKGKLNNDSSSLTAAVLLLLLNY
ncbi:MAG: hypothetical protein PHW82_00595 [Bacteroidales bacterium]|nr:hypothetical protein [Bacteroidales bacterium]